MKTIPKIYQIRKFLSAFQPMDGRAVISFVQNSYADTYISNCSPVTNSDHLEIKILYDGNSSKIPDVVIDDVLTVADNTKTSKHPFRWYQFTSEAAPINNENETKAVRRMATKALLSQINNPEKIWIFEVIHKNKVGVKLVEQ